MWNNCRIRTRFEFRLFHTPTRDSIILIIIIIARQCLWCCHHDSAIARVHPVHSNECRMAPSGRRPKTKPDDLGCESACTGCQIYTHHCHLLLLLSPKAHFSVPWRVEGWFDLVGFLSWWFTHLQTITHPGTNRVWRCATLLIEANVLPLNQTANLIIYCIQ